MAPIPLVEVISFSTEHPVNRVSNIIKNCGKWTIPVKNVSAARGKEITEIQAEFKVPLCRIDAIDIGNFWSSVNYKQDTENSGGPFLSWICIGFGSFRISGLGVFRISQISFENIYETYLPFCF